MLVGQDRHGAQCLADAVIELQREIPPEINWVLRVDGPTDAPARGAHVGGGLGQATPEATQLVKVAAEVACGKRDKLYIFVLKKHFGNFLGANGNWTTQSAPPDPIQISVIELDFLVPGPVGIATKQLEEIKA